jgi:hypothetical protein
MTQAGATRFKALQQVEGFEAFVEIASEDGGSETTNALTTKMAGVNFATHATPLMRSHYEFTNTNNFGATPGWIGGRLQIRCTL